MYNLLHPFVYSLITCSPALPTVTAHLNFSSSFSSFCSYFSSFVRFFFSRLSVSVHPSCFFFPSFSLGRVSPCRSLVWNSLHRLGWHRTQRAPLPLPPEGWVKDMPSPRLFLGSQQSSCFHPIIKSVLPYAVVLI